MTKRVCNVCGKDFDMWDKQEDFSIKTHVGYGSRFDEEVVDLDLCCDCFDRMMLEYIIPRCKHIPVSNVTKEDAKDMLLRMNNKTREGTQIEPE